MARRDSTYYRGRSSVAIVQEARPVALKIYGLVLAFAFVGLALRNIFFCGVPATGLDAEKDFLEGLYPNCANDNFAQLNADLVALFSIVLGLVRYHMAMTTHVADLYLTSVVICVTDAASLLCFIRHGGVHPLYWVLMLAAIGFQGHTLMIARKAYISRLKMTKIYDKDG